MNAIEKNIIYALKGHHVAQMCVSWCVPLSESNKSTKTDLYVFSVAEIVHVSHISLS